VVAVNDRKQKHVSSSVEWNSTGLSFSLVLVFICILFFQVSWYSFTADILLHL